MPNIAEKGQLAPETDLDLNTSANLPEGSVTDGMTPASLADTPSSVLKTGFDRIAEGSVMTDDVSNCAADRNDELNRVVPMGASVTSQVRPDAYSVRKY